VTVGVAERDPCSVPSAFWSRAQ